MLGNGSGRDTESLSYIYPQGKASNVYKIHCIGDSYGENCRRHAVLCAALVIGDGGFSEIPRPQLKISTGEVDNLWINKSSRKRIKIM